MTPGAAGGAGPSQRDPLALVEERLRDAERETSAERRRVWLEEALELLRDSANSPPDPVRVDAYRAEVLRRLGRRGEAGEAYARVIDGVIDNAEAERRGLDDLLDDLCAYEALLDVLPRALARHPGRAWEWQPIGERASERLRLEREAPLTPAELALVRERVAGAVRERPCAHDDDSRPRSAAVVRGLGHDPARVLPWLSALGACCCDCAVARVRGPRESRR